jgi:hypothetical protein
MKAVFLSSSHPTGYLATTSSPSFLSASDSISVDRRVIRSESRSGISSVIREEQQGFQWPPREGDLHSFLFLPSTWLLTSLLLVRPMPAGQLFVQNPRSRLQHNRGWRAGEGADQKRPRREPNSLFTRRRHLRVFPYPPTSPVLFHQTVGSSLPSKARKTSILAGPPKITRRVESREQVRCRRCGRSRVSEGGIAAQERGQ